MASETVPTFLNVTSRFRARVIIRGQGFGLGPVIIHRQSMLEVYYARFFLSCLGVVAPFGCSGFSALSLNCFVLRLIG